MFQSLSIRFLAIKLEISEELDFDVRVTNLTAFLAFSPGLLSKDPLLPFHLLEASRQLYLNGAYGESWVVSPGNYSDLQEFPKVRLLVGDKDPLFYDSLRFAKALQNKGGDVKVTVYEGGLHCLLSLSQAVAEYETVVADSVEYLQELR